jgi:hypothetical protein
MRNSGKAFYADPSHYGSGTVKQKAGMHEFGTSGVNKKLQPGIMARSALLIPWRLAIAMVDSGKWADRNNIIWFKRNGQPAPFTDILIVYLKKISEYSRRRTRRN